MTILSKKIKTNSEIETFNLGKQMAGLLNPGDVIGFKGELGSGKTIFIKGVLSGLGFDERNVNSASFVLVQKYIAKLPVYHIDLFRIEEKYEIYDMDWDSYLSKEALVLIEWAEKIEDFF